MWGWVGTGLCDFGGPLWWVCDDPVDVHLCSPEDLLCPIETCGVDKDEVSADWAHEQERCEEFAHCGRLSLASWSGRRRCSIGDCWGTCWRFVIQQRFVLLNGLFVMRGMSCSARSLAMVSPTMTPR